MELATAVEAGGAARAVAGGGDGRVAASLEEGVRLWRVGAAGGWERLPHGIERRGVELLAFGPRGRLAGFGEGGLEVWDEHGALEADLNGALKTCAGAEAVVGQRLRFQDEASSFATLLALCFGNAVAVVNFATREARRCLRAPAEDAMLLDCIFLYAHGRARLAAVDDLHACHVWDLDSGELMASFTCGELLPRAIAFHDPLARVVVATDAATLLLFDAPAQALAGGVDAPQEPGTTLSFALSPGDAPDGDMEALQNVIGLELVLDVAVVACTLRVVALDVVRGVCLFSRRVQQVCSAFALERSVGLAVLASSLEPVLLAVRIGDAVETCPAPRIERGNQSSQQRRWSKLDVAPAGESLPPEPRMPQVAPAATSDSDHDEWDETRTWSVFPSTDPPSASPLRAAPMQRKGKSKPQQRKLDRPVTFHKRVQSSGYGATPPVRALFSGASPGKKAPAKSGSRAVGAALRVREGLDRVYPSDAPVVSAAEEVDAETEARIAHQSAALGVRFSADGAMLGTCSTDRTARVVRLPVSRSKGDGYDLVGHQESVSSVDFSFSRNLLGGSGGGKKRGAPQGAAPQRPLVLTGSADGTARLWSTHLPDALVTFAPRERGASRLAGVTQAGFFFMDKFCLVAAGPELRLHQYALPHDAAKPAADLEAQQRRNKLRTAVAAAGNAVGSPNQRILTTWSCKGESQGIVSFAAINSFLSHLIIVARSDRSIAVVDAAANRTGRLIESDAADERVAHHVVLPVASVHASHPTGAYDMFVSSSTARGGTLSLWDLRARDCVQSFSGHKNRVQSVGVAISPCMRYIATGSEDNCCYIYDVRTGETLERLRGRHRDTVSDVAYHPLQPRIATACYDGKVRFFGPATGSGC